MSTPAQQIPPLTSSVERRFYPRIVPHAPIFVAFRPFNQCQEGLLLNVSENGLLISTPANLICNFVARLSIPLNTLPKPVQVTVRVIWVSDDRKLAGIQLLDLSEHDRQRIRKWGTQESAQSRQSELDHPQIGVAPFITSSETNQKTRSFTEEPPTSGLLDTLPLAPPLIIRTRPIATVARRAILGALLATVCVAAAFFFRSDALGKVFARLTENRAQSNPVAPPAQDAQGSPENPVASKPNVVTQAATLTPILSAAKSKGALAETPAPEDSSQEKDDSPDAKRVGPGVSPAQAQGYKLRTEPIHPSEPASETYRTPNTDPARSPVEDQAGARETLSSTAAIPTSSDAAPAKNATVDKSSASADAAGESLPAFLVPPTSSEPLPTPTRTAEVPTGASATITSSAPSGLPSRQIVASTRPAFSLKSDAPVVQPVIYMDAPRSQVFEVRLPNGYQRAFFSLPGERVLDSPPVTIYIRRSVRMPGTHGGWPFNRSKKVVVGQLIARVDPQAAQIPASLDGLVRVKATVAKDGHIENVRPILGPATLIPAVLTAVSEWRYQPTLVDNKPVETQCIVVIQFHTPAYRAARR